MDWDPHGIGRTFALLGFLILAAFFGVFFLGRASAGCTFPYKIVRTK